MSTDRELLEMAAKAANMGKLDFDYAAREGHGFYFGPRLPMPQGVLMAAMHTYWDPLGDDGNALRLAVKLGMDILRSERDVEVIATLPQYAQKLNSWVETAPFAVEMIESDPGSATRRAIVRAAAEIGKAMQ